MSVDLDVLEEALRVLTSSPSPGRRHALAVLLSRYGALLARRAAS